MKKFGIVSAATMAIAAAAVGIGAGSASACADCGGGPTPGSSVTGSSAGGFFDLLPILITGSSAGSGILAP
ncbi:hypothetical protein ACFVMC_11225 [Nocardia sp. NPDC127579]|uniref:hypothetical protein n=1 Tax=Nocardia sp. NPDC127579 TaxID=3345402 RepID=UPI00362E175D